MARVEITEDQIDDSGVVVEEEKHVSGWSQSDAEEMLLTSGDKDLKQGGVSLVEAQPVQQESVDVAHVSDSIAAIES